MKLVTDSTRYPYRALPYQLEHSLVKTHSGEREPTRLFAEKRDKMAQHHKKNLEMDLFQEQEETQEHFSYKPTLHADEIGLTSDKYVPLNASVDSLPLVISYSPMTTARWLLMEHMEHTLSQALGGAGATEVRAIAYHSSLFAPTSCHDLS